MKLVEIKPVESVDAVIRAPGSKSYTQRALIIAALAEGESRLDGFLRSEDTSHLIRALVQLGASFEFGREEAAVRGTAGRIAPPSGPIHLGNNGTAMRFLISMAALGSRPCRLTGDPRLCARPVGALVSALQSLGAEVRCERGDGCPPVLARGGGLEGGQVRLERPESSQFVSSLLIASPYARGDVEIVLDGGIVSAPYVGMTLDIMHRFGADIDTSGGNRYRVSHLNRYRGIDLSIEGDVSSASYFFLAAAVSGGRVRVANLNPATRQGDIRVLRVLDDFGCAVASGKDWIEVKGNALRTGDLMIDMGDMPDMVPTVSVLSAFRRGRTRIMNVAHLRLKESDRIEALVNELKKIGAQAGETDDGLMIEGRGSLHGAEIETYNDHRIAMSFAVAGLAVPGIKVRNGECVGKSFPGFWKELNKIETNEMRSVK